MNTTLPKRTNPALETSSAKNGLLYIPQDRRTLVTALVAGLGVLVLIAIIAALYFYRSGQASTALADAMRTYDRPVVDAGRPIPAGIKTFSSAAERAGAANSEFAAIAGKYGMTPAGRNARYLQGVTALQMGQTATAEDLLKKSAGSWSSDVASMANLALAGLYHGSGRDAQAIEIYQKLTAKPTTAVPAGLAQLQLADLYESEGKKDQARKLYAQIKDKDPKSAAAELATQKLGEAPAR